MTGYSETLAKPNVAPWRSALLVVLGVLAIDQAIKIWVKTSFHYYENVVWIDGVFQLLFIENNGMAFGMELGGSYGKLALSLFRVVAVGVIGYYLYDCVRKRKDIMLIICISLIFAGAIGNIIDSIFYGKIFNATCGNERMAGACAPIASIFPEGGTYGTWFHGEVVDMFQITLRWPEWMPLFGGKQIFPPIFNFADAAISIGVALLFIFQKRIFGKSYSTPVEAAT